MPLRSSGSLSTTRSSIFSLGQTPTQAARRIESFIERRWNVNAYEIDLDLQSLGGELPDTVSSWTSPQTNGYPVVSDNDEYTDRDTELSSLRSSEVSTPFSLTGSIVEYPECDHAFVATAKRQLYRSVPINKSACTPSKAVTLRLSDRGTDSCGSKYVYGLLTPARSISQVPRVVPASDCSHTVHTWRASLSEISSEVSDLTSAPGCSETPSQFRRGGSTISSTANSSPFYTGVSQSAKSEAGRYVFCRLATRDIHRISSPLSQSASHSQRKQPYFRRAGPQEFTVSPTHVQDVLQGRVDGGIIACNIPQPRLIVSRENNRHQSSFASSNQRYKECNSNNRCRSSTTRLATTLEPECDVAGEDGFRFRNIEDNRASRSSRKRLETRVIGGLRRWWQTRRLTKRFSRKGYP